jgi:hypothetical protein
VRARLALCGAERRRLEVKSAHCNSEQATPLHGIVERIFVAAARSSSACCTGATDHDRPAPAFIPQGAEKMKKDDIWPSYVAHCVKMLFLAGLHS